MRFVLLLSNSFSKTKLVPQNMRLLAVLGAFIKRCALPVLVGADWNMTPNVLCSVPFLDEFVLSIKADSSAIGSCVSRGGQSVSSIDYFVMSRHLADVVSNIQVCPITVPKPHRPTYLCFNTRPKNVQVCVLKEPSNLPTDPPFGPVVPPSDWQPTCDRVEAVLASSGCRVDGDVYVDVQNESLGTIKQDLGTAMEKWFSHAEQDLLFIVGSRLSSSARGSAPRAISVNLINTFKCPAEGNVFASRAVKWVQLRFVEFAKAIEG